MSSYKFYKGYAKKFGYLSEQGIKFSDLKVNWTDLSIHSLKLASFHH